MKTFRFRTLCTTLLSSLALLAGCSGTATPAPAPAKQTPTLTWATPAAINYGTALSATQLNATASVPGTFTYSPASGAVLNAGTQTLTTTFVPTDTTTYANATASVQLIVNKIATTTTFPTPAPIVFGTALSATQLNATASVPGTFVYAPAAGTILTAGTQTLTATFTPTDPNYATSSASTQIVVTKATPTLIWATPASIPYGTALSATQLNATASTPGSFTYTPAAGTVLAVGTQTLSATFTPTDAVDYTTATATVQLTVTRATPTITWATPAAITYGTALSATQLNATASVPGTFAYTPAAGTVLTVGTQTLSTTFTPADTTTYTTASATVQITITKPVPTITWATPAAIVYGTALSTTQLNATASVPGTFAYTPASGTILTAGTQTLSTTFTPTDTANYSTATASVQLTVNKATPTLSWTTPAAITYGTALSATQLNATASIPGTFTYTPAAGTIPTTGTQALSALFTPTDTVDYTTATTNTTLTVTRATPTLSWTPPAAITYGTALSATQLSATASTPGTFVYTPAAGTIPTTGTQTLSATFTPTDTTNFTTATTTTTLVVSKATPTVSFPTPAPITYGTALSSTQLNATASVAGTFTYTPATGTVLNTGTQTLSVTFSPTDTVNYTQASAAAQLTVNKATPIITWATPAPIPYGTALSATQLNATASVPGTFAYTPAAGTIPAAGTQTLSTTFTPSDPNYATTTATVQISVTRATPTLTWATPAAITYGTALSSTQLNATASVPGTFAYTPAAGTLLTAGTQTLSVTFTPTDTTSYGNATTTVTLTVAKATPTLSWTTPAAIGYGTTLSSAQLNATSSVPGTFVYTPAAGATLNAGTQTLSATFTPTDATDYTTATITTQLTIVKATPVLNWTAPAAITYGTPLSSAQLSATSPPPGTFAYTPAAGTILNAGTQTLSTTFTPTDTTNYTTASVSVQFTVNQASPTVTWATPAPITYGTPLSSAQLNPTAPIPGTFAFAPGLGAVLDAGPQTLATLFSPTDTLNYTNASQTVTLTVNPAAPAITWPTPPSIVYGTPLDGSVLNATSPVSGTFAYTPDFGTVLTAGTQTLSTTFTSSDPDYANATATVQLTITKATPTDVWPDPAAILIGAPLTSTQLNAVASVPGTFVYTPPAGTTFATAGTYNLHTVFTPTDTTNYNGFSDDAVIAVGNKLNPTITWATPAAIPYGTPYSATQLNATASVPGTFAYSPAAGTVATKGTHALSVTFTPTDTATYNTATASVNIIVTQALPLISWTPGTTSIASGATVPTSALNATATNLGTTVAGTFAYTPSAGTTEIVPGTLVLSVIFTPTDTTDFQSATATAKITVTAPTGTPSYTWKSVDIRAGGFTDGLYFHPTTPNLLYARMDIGGAYRYDFTNNRWLPLLDWINRNQGNYFHTDYWGLGALGLDPTDPKYLYLGVGIGSSTTVGNFLISSDQGATFTNVLLPFVVDGNQDGREGGDRIAVDPNLPSRIYYGTNNAGLYYSDNRGLTWAKSTSFPNLQTGNNQGIDFVLPVKASGSAGSLTPVLFAGVAEKISSGTLNTLYISTNAGTSWAPFTGNISGTLLPIRGRLGPDHELYVTYSDVIGPSGATSGMVVAYTYTDAGLVTNARNITPTITPGSTAGFAEIAPDPVTKGTLLTATIYSSYASPSNGVLQDYIYRSTDDGATWKQFTTDTHDTTIVPWEAASIRNHDGDWINFAIDPFNTKHVVYATGSMIWATNDVSATNVAWVSQALNEEEHNTVALAAPPSGSNLLYAGVHDHNGFGFPSLSAPPPRFPNANNNATNSIAYAEQNPLVVARVGGNKDFSATTAPYGAVTTNGGSSWTTLATPAGSTAGAGSVAVSADGGTIVWAPYDVNAVYSTDGGQTWINTTGTPGKQRKVVADHIDNKTFYMSSLRYQSNPPYSVNSTLSLYESVDGGHSFAAVAGTSALPTGDAYTNFALEGDVWLTAPGNGVTGGLYRNTGTRTAIVMTKQASFTNAYHMAFGAPKPGSGYTYTVYVDGRINGIDGLYRSTDGGTTWVLIFDQLHQFGYMNCIEADRRTFGTVYLGLQGRGVMYGTSTN